MDIRVCACFLSDVCTICVCFNGTELPSGLLALKIVGSAFNVLGNVVICCTNGSPFVSFRRVVVLVGIKDNDKTGESDVLYGRNSAAIPGRDRACWCFLVDNSRVDAIVDLL